MFCMQRRRRVTVSPRISEVFSDVDNPTGSNVSLTYYNSRAVEAASLLNRPSGSQSTPNLSPAVDDATVEEIPLD